MTTYSGRTRVAFRRSHAKRSAHCTSPTRRELCAGNRPAFATTPFRCSEGFEKSGIRWPGRRTNAGANATLPPGASLLRLRRTAGVSRPTYEARSRAPRTRWTTSPEAKKDWEAPLKLTAESNVQTVAHAVFEALERAGVRAVLTGGACASIHTAGEYQSEDVDFILQSAPSQQKLDEAMATIGFRRRRDQYFHARTRFFVEFPAGPLGIGRDLAVKPVRRKNRVSGSAIRILSATDSCRDRLAAFYHWNDRQSLDVAVRIALKNRVDIKRIRTWSTRESASESFKVFIHELALARRRRRA
jgi:hypothetical protein